MSSTPNRRSHEDGGNGSGSANHSHPSALKNPHDDQGTYPGKVVMPTRHDYHAPHDMVQDSRMTKTASRDSERRLPLAPNSLPRASNDAHPDHVGSETKEIKVDHRDMKSDSRELQQSVNRVDDGKDAKHEKESEMKVDKDVYSGSNNQLSYKEQYRVKQYPDGQGEAVKEGHHGEERESKDKDRKRKDMKHRDWGEKDKERNDRRINVQGAVGSVGENKEALREERELERMVVEKKDPLREKEKLTEKIQFKREALEKDGKESVNPHGKSVEQEFSEHKKKDYESWKNAERESRERKKERDTDVESERPDKRSKFHEKESEECAMETEGGLEKEREAFNSGVQQRKRMLRPRGSPQTGNRDLRIKPHTTDTEGPLGPADVCVVYKVGECLKDLTKMWREYKLSKVDRAGGESSLEGPTVEVRIPAEHVTATNKQVRGGQLWGTDVYTFDSDLVAVLMHTGFCRPTASPPPSGTQELRATIRVVPPQECYVSTLRNNVRSRAWGAAIGCSYRVEKCCIVKKDDAGRIDIVPCLTQSSTMEPTLAPVSVERTMTTRAAASNALRQQRFLREVTIQFNLCNEPWLKYSISAVADKGLKRNQYTSARVKKGEVLYVETHTRRYELCFSGEKLIKNAIAQISATGAENGKNQAHTNGERNAVEGEHTLVDVYRWSVCKKPIPQRKMLSMGIPLPRENVQVILDDLEWESIAWTQTGVRIGDKEYYLVRAHFLAPI